jgi:predicted TIM-barrel fold metal-dependent hydrolase
MPAASEDWLALVREDPIDPALPIIDAHHHLWDHPDHRYLAKDFAADANSGHNIRQSVFVECLAFYRNGEPARLKPVGETQAIRELAGAHGSDAGWQTKIAAGIVGFADLTLGRGVNAVLAAHIEAGAGRFRGIRHASSWDASSKIRNAHTDPPEGLLADASFRQGFACLAQHDLSFDAWLYHPQIPELTALAHAFPDTVFILDHVGGPLGIGPYAGKRDQVFARWKNDIAELARCANVCVKLGGIAMKMNGYDWHGRDKPPGSIELADAAAPWFDHCIEQFGVQRCMFESNFPVDKLSCSYNVLWNAFKRITQGFSVDERSALFHGTAARVYRLELP